PTPSTYQNQASGNWRKQLLTGESESKETTTDRKGYSTATDLQERATSASSDLKDRSKPHTALTETSSAAVHSPLVKNGDKKIKKKPVPRYCWTCEAFKPPRSHHCRICKKCILKMDHHCPWVNNCVGYYNYGHFIRFVTWVTLTTSFCLALLIWRIVDAIQNDVYYMYRHDGPTKLQVIFMAVNIVVDGGVLLAVGILCIYHLWCMASNTSTIEVWEQEKVAAMVKKGKLPRTKFPYDVGCFRNYRQVLGPSIWFWFWPQKMTGSGTEFDVTDDKDAPLLWPPREYQTSKRQDRTVVSEYTSSSIHYREMHQQRLRPRSRNHSASGHVPPTGDPYSNGRGSGGQGRVSRRRRQQPQQQQPEFPTHIRRGSEGWIVQDLSVEQRAELYDRQVQYQRENEQVRDRHDDDPQDEEGEEEEDYQEGLSDIERDVYGRLPGGMQGNDYHSYDRRVESESSEEDDDIPYDVASDEYDDDGYGDYDDGYDDHDGFEGGDDDFDEQNPYLGYEDEEDEGDDEEDGEEDSEGEDEDMEDEVALHGRDRHKIGRFFDSIGPDGADEDGGRDQEDEWDEGEGIEVGCRPPNLTHRTSSSNGLRYDPGKKTFYTMLVEREEALKKQKAMNK
ncbi:Palmitoyltransferase, partial [Mortierella alpina]